MTIDRRAAAAIAVRGVLGRLRQGFDLIELDALPSPVYGFDPAGWLLYSVRRADVHIVGADWIVAVNAATGEVRDLGRVGE